MTEQNQEIVRILDWHEGAPILLFNEIAEPNQKSIKESWQQARDLAKNKPFHIIADISDVKPPSAEVRAAIKKEYMKLKPQILSTQMYIGKNFLIKIAWKFLAASTGLENFSLAKSVEEAVVKIKDKLL